MTLGERLKEARIYNDFKQAEVASMLGINFRTVSSWENNSTRPAPEDLLRLSRLYGVSVDELLGNPARDVTALPKNAPILAAYNRAPKQIQDIILAALAPYMVGREKEASA
jgi:transcriptional regulator with XRE-family HTH domain